MHGLIFETSICYRQDQPGNFFKKTKAHPKRAHPTAKKSSAYGHGSIFKGLAPDETSHPLSSTITDDKEKFQRMVMGPYLRD